MPTRDRLPLLTARRWLRIRDFNCVGLVTLHVDRPSAVGNHGVHGIRSANGGWMNGLELFIWHGSDKSFVVCRGEVDVATAGRLSEAVELCLETSPRLLCIDGCGITFFSSSGVQVLIDAAEQCYDRGVELELALSEQAERVVRLCRADLLLASDDRARRREDAIRSSDRVNAMNPDFV